jgi:rare lipoprotein A (peptidoglycan hydrolase)
MFKFSYLKPLLTIILLTPLLTFNQGAFFHQEESVSPEVAAPEVEEIVYTVKSGDSLCKIADHYKVLLSDLVSWNNINANTRLHPGDTIIVKRVDYEAREGLASWYGPNFHGKHMANTEVYNMYDIVVAHRTLPLGREVKITNLENGRSIIAPVLDRGPYVKNANGEYTREIDLSYAVAQELGTIQKGVVRALIEPINEPLAMY